MNTTIEQVEWFDDRYYRILTPEGAEGFYPSVTTILGIVNKPFLSRWRGDVGNYEADRKMNFAAWRGSRIHDAIHRGFSPNGDGKRPEISFHDENGKKQFTQEEWLQIVRFKVWYDLFKPKVLYSELVVCSNAFGYAGTCDLICELQKGEYPINKRTTITIPETGIYIGDLKTGAGIDEEYHHQTAAYAQAVSEEKTAQPAGTFIIHTNASSQTGFAMQLRNADEAQEDFLTFKAALTLWQRKNPHQTPKVFTMPPTITFEEN